MCRSWRIGRSWRIATRSFTPLIPKRLRNLNAKWPTGISGYFGSVICHWFWWNPFFAAFLVSTPSDSRNWSSRWKTKMLLKNASCLPSTSSEFWLPSTKRSATPWRATRTLWTKTLPTRTVFRSAWKNSCARCIRTGTTLSATSAICWTRTRVKRSGKRRPLSSTWTTLTVWRIRAFRCLIGKNKVQDEAGYILRVFFYWSHDCSACTKSLIPGVGDVELSTATW